ncbi:MAG: hypothetical protein J5680_08005 [Neisseriaceae bacterium]|nr:hypothetical protein [Neisseriaceae bacterium]
MARRGAFKASLATPDIKKMTAEIQKALPHFADSVVDAVSAEVLRTAKNNAYRAEQAYMHYWNKGLTKEQFAAGTLEKLLYSFTLPMSETKGVYMNKVAVFNNNETGYMGNIAMLLEYGTDTMPAQPFFRNSIKAGRQVMKTAVKQEFERYIARKNQNKKFD